ncbi:uncharacterized protein LOC115970990 isoform X2 [Quercus lobata]|nr:uncharacterized protein LOC115970990 isoform X2 [Quercus lobata]XP_030946509.1 uncharacterized protein LOC115970990 isoform X2 [Quercus lobata]
MYVSQHLIQILREMNLPVIMISSNDNNINSHYHWLVGNIVRPILELVENLFYDRINKSGEVKRLKEEIKQVELPDEEKRLKEEVEHDELPDEEKLPEEKRLKEEVEHAELPDKENKKKLEREKAGEHHQRMVWTGDRERMFVKIVTELDKNGKATGKKVWELMHANGFKDISLKQVNSHLQKHRGKLKKVHPVGKDQVDTSPGQGASRNGTEEHSSKTDAPMNTINGNLNTTSQKQHLITELLNNNIPGNFGNPNTFYDRENFENGKGKDIIQDWNCMDDDFFGTSSTQVLQSSPEPIETTPLTIKSYTMGGCQSSSTPLYTMGGCQSNSSMTMEGQPSNLPVNDIHGQAFDKNVPDLQSEKDQKVYTPTGIYFGDFNYEDIDPQQHSINMDIDAFKMNNNVWGF